MGLIMADIHISHVKIINWHTISEMYLEVPWKPEGKNDYETNKKQERKDVFYIIQYTCITLSNI